MQSFLDMLPAGYHEAFGITGIFNPERLGEARATAFTWTGRPGSVCLGLNRKYYDEAATNSNVAVIVSPKAAVTAAPAGSRR